MSEASFQKEPQLIPQEKLMKPYLVRPLTADESKDIKTAATDPKQLELTRTLLSKDALKPINLLTIGKRKFFVAASGAVGGTLVMFYEDPITKKLMPRTVIESLSGRSWRSTPGMKGGYSKGTGIHYTQEAKPHKNIIRYIDSSVTNGNIADYGDNIIEDYFQLAMEKGRLASFQPEWYTFDKEIGKYNDNGVLKQFQQYRPGHLRKAEVGDNANLSEKFRNFDFSSPELKAFLPNFENPPVEVDTLKHTYLGEITLETYTASLNGRPVEWVMAYDKEGRVWIERIAFLDIEVNSYAVIPEVIDSGCLTNKPFEYEEQVSALKEGEESIDREDVGYSDITPLLDNLLPIQQFRKARHIAPYRTPGAIALMTVENAKNFAELKIAIAKKGRVVDYDANNIYLSRDTIALLDKASGFQIELDKLPKIEGLTAAVKRARENELKMIAKAVDFDQLYKSLDEIGGLQGSSEYFVSWELRTIIDKVRRGELSPSYVTGGGNLRDTVWKLMQLF